MTRFPVLLCILLGGLLLSGCASGKAEKIGEKQSEAVPLEQIAVSEKEFLQTAEKLMREQIQALHTGNYAVFSANLFELSSGKMTPENFARISRSFCTMHGKLERIEFLGTVSKYKGRTVLWKGWFTRTPEVEKVIRKYGFDPAKIRQNEDLIRMGVVYVNGKWKVLWLTVE